MHKTRILWCAKITSRKPFVVTPERDLVQTYKVQNTQDTCPCLPRKLQNQWCHFCHSACLSVSGPSGVHVHVHPEVPQGLGRIWRLCVTCLIYHGDVGLVRILIQADAGGPACDLVLAETKPCNQSAKAGPRPQLNSVNAVVEPCVMAGPISLYGLPISYITSWQESWKTCAVQDCEISPWHFA